MKYCNVSNANYTRREIVFPSPMRFVTHLKGDIKFIVFGIVFLWLNQAYAQQNSEKMVWVEVAPSSGLHKGFFIDRFEVSIAEFAHFVRETGYKTDAEKKSESYAMTGKRFEIVSGVNWRCDFYGEPMPDSLWEAYPVGHISPGDAEAYAKWVGKRIPTIKEWWYAAKAGIKSKGYRYSGGNNARNVGWFDNNSREIPQRLGMLQPNELGIYDMSGNAFELCIIEEKNKYVAQGGSFFSAKEMLGLDMMGFMLDSVHETFPTFGIRCVKD